MPEKIHEYHAIQFPTALEAVAVASKIQNAVVSPSGLKWMSGPSRAVIWTGSPIAKEGNLYLSSGAITAAQSAGIGLPPGITISASALPPDRTLVLGDSSDWKP